MVEKHVYLDEIHRLMLILAWRNHQSAQATVSDLHVPLLELLSKPLRGELQLETGQKGLEVGKSQELLLETVRSKI